MNYELFVKNKNIKKSKNITNLELALMLRKKEIIFPLQDTFIFNQPNKENIFYAIKLKDYQSHPLDVKFKPVTKENFKFAILSYQPLDILNIEILKQDELNIPDVEIFVGLDIITNHYLEMSDRYLKSILRNENLDENIKKEIEDILKHEIEYL